MEDLFLTSEAHVTISRATLAFLKRRANIFDLRIILIKKGPLVLALCLCAGVGLTQLFMDVTTFSTNLAMTFHWILLQAGLLVITIHLLGWRHTHKA